MEKAEKSKVMKQVEFLDKVGQMVKENNAYGANGMFYAGMVGVGLAILSVGNEVVKSIDNLTDAILLTSESQEIIAEEEK